MPYDIIIGRNKSDKEKFGDKGLVYIGKGYVKMGNYTSMSNKIWMDVARSHVILVAGKRGCLTEETLIFTDKGYKKIIDFNEKEDKILSFNKEKNKFEWETAKLLEYNIKDEEILQITLKDGRKINLTKEHPLLSSYGKYKFYRRGCDLKIGDKIILPTKIPEIKKDKESLRIARLLGYILSDGSIGIRKEEFKDGRGRLYNGTKARIRIHNACNEVLEQAKEDLEKEFQIKAKRYKRNDCNCEIVETKHQKIANKFMNLGIPKGNKSGIIKIPEIVFESSNKFKAEFISALFDCDGYVEPKGKTIDYSSKSRKFLEDLQLILTHFKIESVIRKKNARLNGKVYENHRLFITDNTSIENFKKIPLRNKYKKDRIKEHKPNNTRKRKTHYLSESLVCNKIISIKKLKGVNKVYDLTVDKNHSFIANGIISHNSGKSYTLGAIAEEISGLPEDVSKNIAVLMFDTMGIFWTMKYKNEKDKELLDEWDLKARELPVKIFVPFGKVDEYKKKNIPVDATFALKASELEAEDWITIFKLDATTLPAVLMQRVISRLKERSDNYTIAEIQEEIERDPKANPDSKEVASSLFGAADTWGIFSKTHEGTEISDLTNAGTTTVLDVSVYSSAGAYNIRALVVSLVSRKLFASRMDSRKKEELESIQHGHEYLSYKKTKQDDPLVWIFIDEAHEFLPEDATTPATEALKQILREGRQPGISLVMATQQPGRIHHDVMTQSDIIISHRVTSKPDVNALNEIMQTYLLDTISKQMAELPSYKGSAIILDDNSERLYPIRVRPRFTWHGGEAPIAIKTEVQL